MNALAEMAEFKPMVAYYWRTTILIHLSNSSLFRFTKKMKYLKPLIRKLAKERLGNLVKKTKKAYADLCRKQEENFKNPSTRNLKEENAACIRWKFVADLEEEYLKQKSKIHWL